MKVSIVTGLVVGEPFFTNSPLYPYSMPSVNYFFDYYQYPAINRMSPLQKQLVRLGGIVGPRLGFLTIHVSLFFYNLSSCCFMVWSGSS
jgi:hypothetical protein